MPLVFFLLRRKYKMVYSSNHSARGSIKQKTPHILISATFLVISSWIYASDDAIPVIGLELGDYRFLPQEIQLSANQPAILRLVNTDSVTPHRNSTRGRRSSGQTGVSEMQNPCKTPPAIPKRRWTVFAQCGRVETRGQGSGVRDEGGRAPGGSRRTHMPFCPLIPAP